MLPGVSEAKSISFSTAISEDEVARARTASSTSSEDWTPRREGELSLTKSQVSAQLVAGACKDSERRLSFSFLVRCLEVPAGLYHERQGACRGDGALHCVNNMLQWHAYEAADLRLVGREVEGTNDAKSVFQNMFFLRFACLGNLRYARGPALGAISSDGMGNVIQAALGRHGFAVRRCDCRNALVSILASPKLVGLILHEGGRRWTCSGKASHWLSVCRCGSKFFNLDGAFEQPRPLGCADELLAWLGGMGVEFGDCGSGQAELELFQVVQKQDA